MKNNSNMTINNNNNNSHSVNNIFCRLMSLFDCVFHSLVPPEVLQSQTTLTLRKNARNVTVDCYGYGKPLPQVAWMKGADIIPRVSAVTGNNNDKVVQMSFNTTGAPWNVTSRLSLRSDGVTYREAGNYTCHVTNGVGIRGTVNATTEVLCEYFLY